LSVCAEKYTGVEHKVGCTLRDGVASSGKTHYIINHVVPGDYVVCETGHDLEELKEKILARYPDFSDRCWTVDSALHNQRVVDSVDVLWIDEALRLHGAKIVLLQRMLRPRSVMCFGDSEQIGPTTFLEGYDFLYHNYPFDKVDVVSEAWTMLKPIAAALSGPDFYNRPVTTHGLLGPEPRLELYTYDDLKTAAATLPDTVVLTFTRLAAKELRDIGIWNAITVGKSQGKRWDHVIVVRHTTNKLVLFYDRRQALVAVTRARRSVKFFTLAVSDDSAAAGIARSAARAYVECASL